MLNEKQLKKQLEGMSKEERTAYFIKLQETVENASPFEKAVSWPKTMPKTVNKETIEVPYTCVENTQALLDHYTITARYNEMSKEIDIEVPGHVFHRDTELNTKLTWIINEAHHKIYPKMEIDEHIALIASKNAYHPVREWVLSKPWDGKSRLEDFYKTIVSDTPIKEMLMRKWGIMAIAAAFHPHGIRPQGVLTFEGVQGLGKTTWLSSIVGNHKEWIGEGQALDPHDKDSVLEVVSKWIVELGEIQATFTRSDIQSLKAFITKQEDRLRPAYAKKADTYARRTVFFGTVDEANFLNDKNGTRRFWVISVSDVDVNHMIDCQQLWAEFYSLWHSGEQWWMDREDITAINAHNEQYAVIDPIEEIVSQGVEVPAGTVHDGEWANATTICQRLGIKNPSKADANSVARYLRNRGSKFKKEYRQFYVKIRVQSFMERLN